MERCSKDTEKVVQQFLDYPSAEADPAQRACTPTRSASAGRAGPDGKTARRAKRPEEEARGGEAGGDEGVDGLKLQSIISGSRKACMINGSLYQEGQQVSGVEFTMGRSRLRRRRRRVREIHVFKLKMQKSRGDDSEL